MNYKIKTIFVFVILITLGSTNVYAKQETRNTIKFENRSGRNAVVRVMGPTKSVAKMQRDETRIVQVAAGEYYVLVRYGDSVKEYTYTKSAPFSVTESDAQYSIITFTLHRRGGGTFNVQPVSGTEFETSVYTTDQVVSP